ncbi:MAG: M20/M25/M40 family metallo-hydrolase [Pyrinomonadaceae bacterium]
MLKRRVLGVFVLYALLIPTVAFGQTSVYTAPQADIDKIKNEGMNNSEVMKTLGYLTDVIGSRLTGSPNLKRANEWTRDTMAKWGMQNAKLEAWGPFGRGWALKEFQAEIVDPQTIPVAAFPKAWSPSTKGKITGEVVFLEINSDADFAKYRGQLKGKIVMMSQPRDIAADFDGMGSRLNEEELLALANAPDPNAPRPAGAPQGGAPQFTPQMMERLQRFALGLKAMNFLLEEGAAVAVDNSRAGSGGTIFVQGADVAQEVPANPIEIFTRRDRLSPQQKAAEAKMIPQMVVATEDYNRIARMIQQGVKPKMTVNIQTQYYDDDPMAYNTVAEIPGTDPTLKSQLVMLGGHIDSWHSGTGATDNGAGVAVAMEAARIIIASGLKPRRTIRVGLWSGEEQGLFGSSNYVKQHFGEMKGGGNIFGIPEPNAKKPELIKGADYDNLSAYYNLDNGTGKIRGVYMQGNSAVRPYFAAWLAPFADMGARTLTLSNTGGTDHLAFDGIGLPGFQFIQDGIEYDTRTHHSNQDVFDRIQAADMKQAATIMAAFVYQTAMMDEKMPRKN